MAKTIEAPAATEGKKGKKGLIITLLVAIIAIGAGAGGVWYFMKMSGGEESEPAQPKPKPTKFVDLDVFTVNLQPEENNQYLQVGLTIKARETEVIQEITKQMPDIRNRILMLLSSKKAAEIAGIQGKQLLSQQIAEEIKKSLDSEELQDDIREVLFTSFVIQ
ncbi:MAG: flagellar basal body-associated protein FliL [Proteobacteria bacterium]|nr:flagellar basal body-associated protein FliL [Pseudomonadota bacterium]